jgi:hypothetical protein
MKPLSVLIGFLLGVSATLFVLRQYPGLEFSNKPPKLRYISGGEKDTTGPGNSGYSVSDLPENAENDSIYFGNPKQSNTTPNLPYQLINHNHHVYFKEGY